MTGLILAVLALFVVQCLLPAFLRYYSSGSGFGAKLSLALGTRDEQPPLSIVGRRAKRALANMFEALPVFLTLAILLHLMGDASRLATSGAAVFLLSRAAYVPAYLAGIYAVRTLLWLAGWAGLLMMLAALVG
ncbi:MAG: MAPEG family protein [Rhizobiaceae bacterium]